MKGLKKLLTGILAATMIMGCTLTAYATDDSETPAEQTETSSEAGASSQTTGTGTIRITNAKKGQEYKAYRVFDFVPTGSDMTSGVYKLSSKFSGFTSSAFTVKDGVISGTITEVGEGEIPTEAAQKAAEQLGKDAIAYAANMSADGSGTATDDGVLDISVDGYGYYVVNSSLGVAVSVNTTTPIAEIKEKNVVPTTNKQVQESNSWGDTSDANIGDTVNYKSTVSIPAGGVHNVKFTDEMTNSLNLDAESIMVDGVAAGSSEAVDSVKATEHGFEIVFKDSVTSAVTESTNYVITYSAVLNSSAVIKGSETRAEFNGGNDNRSKITYVNNVDSAWDFTRTYTYPVKIVKVNGGNEALAGAEFTLAKTSSAGTLISFIKVDDGNYRVATNGEEGATTTLVVGTNGIVISGLDRDVYRLTETKAPEGYNLLTPVASDTSIHYIDFTISATPVCASDTTALEALLDEMIPVVTYTSEYLTTADKSFTLADGLRVVNTSGTVLPSTGGVGTTIFYIVGAVLIIAGVAYFILKRKADAE